VEQNLGQFFWLILGILLTILFQNFVNDPVKDWRARRSKRYERQRLSKLKSSVDKLEELASKQGEEALKITAEINEILHSLFLTSQIVIGGGTMVFAGQLVSLVRGDDRFIWPICLIGLFSCISGFYLSNEFRSLTKRLMIRAYSITNFESYKGEADERIEELERRASKS